MKFHTKKPGWSTSVPVALITGMLVSVGTLLIGSVIIATLIHNEVMEENVVRYGIPFAVITASYLGCHAAYGRIQDIKLLISILCGLILYFSLIGFTCLFLGGEYDGIGATGLLILCGCVLNILPSRTVKRVGKRYKRY